MYDPYDSVAAKGEDLDAEEGDRHAEDHLRRAVGAVVLGGVVVGVVQLAPGQVVAQRHARIGEERVGVGEAVAFQVAAARGLHRHAVAGAEEVARIGVWQFVLWAAAVSFAISWCVTMYTRHLVGTSDKK